MNLINKIIILVIIIFLINHLTNGKIFETISNYFNICVEKMKDISGIKSSKETTKPIPFAGQLDFPYLNNFKYDPKDELDEESYNLYRFINSRITHNVYDYEMNVNKNEPHQLDSDGVQYIERNLKKMFNSSEYEFNNMKILDKLYYFKNMRGMEIIPFKFTADVKLKSGDSLGTLLIHVESYIYEEKNGNRFAILNTRLLNRKHSSNLNEKTKPKTDERRSTEWAKVNKVESFDDVFIKSDKSDELVNDDDDIIIPTVNISDYEGESPYITSEIP